jgi:cation diffusion facilitator CzcD-associated flavoprotein CzcO
MYIPGPKLADWLEYYAGALELNVWTSSRLVSSRQDAQTLRWTLEIERADGGRRTLVANHLVMAIGVDAGTPVLPTIEGMVCSPKLRAFAPA